MNRHEYVRVMRNRGRMPRRQFLRTSAVTGAALGGLSWKANAAEDPHPPADEPEQLLPFRNQVSRSLWVAISGDDSGSGAHDDPLRSIQAALGKATPGTAVRVRAGIYDGSVVLDGVHGTADAPIILISADGLHEATINGATDNAAIRGHRTSNVGVFGFHLQANVAQPGPDLGAVKIWGDYEVADDNNPTHGVVIAGWPISTGGSGDSNIWLRGTTANASETNICLINPLTQCVNSRPDASRRGEGIAGRRRRVLAPSPALRRVLEA